MQAGLWEGSRYETLRRKKVLSLIWLLTDVNNLNWSLLANGSNGGAIEFLLEVFELL